MLSRRVSLSGSVVLFVCFVVKVVVAAAPPGEWSRFRGPNGSGVSEAANVPIAFGPADKLVWRLALPRGHSSPIIWGDRIYLTAFRDQALVTIAIDRSTGRILWERAAPGAATKSVDARNNPASPSPAVEANGIYVFFPDYGMVAYEADGRERWKMPLGPFNNIYGMGASPVIVGNDVVLACDQSTGSFVMAVDKRIGRPSLEDAAAGGEERSRDADRLARARRPQRDPAARLLPADGLRRRHGREALVGARPVVRDQVHAGRRSATRSSSTATVRRRTIPDARSTCLPPARCGRRPTPTATG